jgi:N-acetyltransferase
VRLRTRWFGSNILREIVTKKNQEEVFREFFREALASASAFVSIDRQTQEIIGSSRYFRFDSGKSEIEIGWTFLARAYWDGPYNAEVKL